MNKVNVKRPNGGRIAGLAIASIHFNEDQIPSQ